MTNKPESVSLDTMLTYLVMAPPGSACEVHVSPDETSGGRIALFEIVYLNKSFTGPIKFARHVLMTLPKYMASHPGLLARCKEIRTLFTYLSNCENQPQAKIFKIQYNMGLDSPRI